MAIEEGVNKTESLSQMPSPDVKSPVTTQPLPTFPLSPASPAVSCVSDTTTSSTMQQQAMSQNVTAQSSQQVVETLILHLHEIRLFEIKM